jgi:hypothetical protein
MDRSDGIYPLGFVLWADSPDRMDASVGIGPLG